MPSWVHHQVSCVLSILLCPLSNYRLLIKSAILMPGAKEDEVNIVRIESKGFGGQQVEKRILTLLGFMFLNFLFEIS